jgi:hypothetical protein
MKMEPIQCSETLVKIQTPGNYPEDNILQHCEVLSASRRNSQGKQACSFESLGVHHGFVVNNTTHVNRVSRVIFLLAAPVSTCLVLQLEKV